MLPKNIKYWWVSQKQTFNQESEGGYMWSPKVNKNGSSSHYYDNMTRVQEGDVVFSFKGGLIVSVGVIQSKAYSSKKPDEFGLAGNAWKDEGWRVDVEYHLLSKKIKPKDHIEAIRSLFPEKYSPLKPDGNGNQAYLFSVPLYLATKLVELIGYEALDVIDGLAVANHNSHTADSIEEEIKNDSTIDKTEKQQLVKSRRGQGLFRSRVEKVEPCCRLTEISYKSHLIASHIKPWSDSDNIERLDGNNGLLLAPHVDHLFDKGFISFEDNGDLLISKHVPEDLLAAWSITEGNFGKFNEQQKVYMQYHRTVVFEKFIKV